jgi:hypothetical protein
VFPDRCRHLSFTRTKQGRPRAEKAKFIVKGTGRSGKHGRIFTVTLTDGADGSVPTLVFETDEAVLNRCFRSWPNM